MVERAALPMSELPGTKHPLKDHLGGVRADAEGQFSWGPQSQAFKPAKHGEATPWLLLPTLDGNFKTLKNRDLSKSS